MVRARKSTSDRNLPLLLASNLWRHSGLRAIRRTAPSKGLLASQGLPGNGDIEVRSQSSGVDTGTNRQAQRAGRTSGRSNARS